MHLFVNIVEDKRITNSEEIKAYISKLKTLARSMGKCQFLRLVRYLQNHTNVRKVTVTRVFLPVKLTLQ